MAEHQTPEKKQHQTQQQRHRQVVKVTLCGISVDSSSMHLSFGNSSAPKHTRTTTSSISVRRTGIIPTTIITIRTSITTKIATTKARATTRRKRGAATVRARRVEAMTPTQALHCLRGPCGPSLRPPQGSALTTPTYTVTSLPRLCDHCGRPPTTPLFMSITRGSTGSTGYSRIYRIIRATTRVNNKRRVAVTGSQLRRRRRQHHHRTAILSFRCYRTVLYLRLWKCSVR